MYSLLSFLEEVQYESRPLVYASLSIYSLVQQEATPLLLFSGVVLGVCCFYVCKMRFQYRQKHTLL